MSPFEASIKVNPRGGEGRDKEDDAAGADWLIEDGSAEIEADDGK
jgi:hypothetical protein